MFLSRKKWALLVGVAAVTPAVVFSIATTSRGSDHADTPTIAMTPGADLTDVFVFPSPNDPSKVVLAMDVHPLIPTGMAGSVSFDPDVLYQFKIDNVGDSKEHLVIQAKFTGTGPNQVAAIAGPLPPANTGTQNLLLVQQGLTLGTINQTFSPQPNITAFCGAREDPFFFDLNQFFKILPDRASPLTGKADPTPDTPKDTSFNPKVASGGRPAASDGLAGFNVLSIVVELPRAMLVGNGSGKIGVWCTTSK
jgi:hypothetical protein